MCSSDLLDQALAREFALGEVTIASGETFNGAARFASGIGRGGVRVDSP